MQDIMLDDGTRIPKGTLIGAAAYPTHHDDTNYRNAEEFDPFRFCRLRENEGEDLKHQFHGTTVDYLPFGHGQHAW